MSEITATKDKPLPFGPIAFTSALVLAPIVVTVLTCFLLIPIAALLIGGPVYLAIGTPVLLWMVGRQPPTFGPYALAGLLGNVALIVFAYASISLQPAAIRTYEGMTLAYWGLPFAPLWAGTFALLYRRFHA